MSDKVKETKKTRNKDKSAILRLSLAFLIPFIIAIIALAAGHFAPFGDKDVLSAGHFEKYRYLLNDLHDKVHDDSVNTSGFISGQGYDIKESWAFYLSDPTNLITLAFPKSDMADVLDILYAFKIGLAGLFFSMLLNYKKKKEQEDKLTEEKCRSKIIESLKAKKEAKKAKKLAALEKSGKADKNIDIKIGGNDEPKSKFGIFIKNFDIINLALSISYALSAYMIGSGLNVTWLGAVALFPLVILAIEKLVYEGKWMMYCFSLTASFFLNFYITIIVFFFTLIYFFLQDYRNSKHLVVSIIKKFISDILAIGMASVVIVTSLRSDLIGKMLSLEFPKALVKLNIFDLFKFQLAGMKIDAAVESDNIAIYSGILTLLMIFMYASNGNINFNRKLKNIILTAVLYIATFHTTMNYFFSGLYYPKKFSAIFGFILIFMTLNMAHSVFINIEHQRSLTVLLSFVIVTSIVIITMVKSTDYSSMTPFMTALELAAVYFLIILLYKNDNMTHTVLKTALGIIVIAEMAFSYGGNLSKIGKTSNSYEKTSIGKYESAEEYIRNTYGKDSKISVFIDGENISTPLTNMLCGYDYVIALSRTNHINDGLEKVESYNGVDIYKNNYVIDNGFFVNDNIKRLVYDSEEIFLSNNYLANNTLGGNDIYEIAIGEMDVQQVSVVLLNSPVKRPENRYRVSFIPEKAGSLYSMLNSNITHMGEAEADQELFYHYSIGAKPLFNHETNIQFALFDKESFEDIYDKVNKAQLAKSSDGKNDYTLSSDKPGYALIPVNSKNVTSSSMEKIFTIGDSNFALIKVDSGSNNISIENVSLIPILIFISIICLLVCILWGKVLAKHANYDDSKVIGKISVFAENNRTYLLTLSILSIIFVIYLFLRSTAPFGIGFFPSHDGVAQNFPFYYGYYKQIFRGDFSFINYNIGLGIDSFGKAFLTFLPVYYLIAFFSLSNMPLCFTLIAYLLFILPAFSFMIYLTHRPNKKNMSKKDLRLIPFALAYGLSAYVISFMSHHSLVINAILLPLLILAFERLIYKKKYIMYVFILTYTMMDDFYMAFLMCEFIFLYFMCQNFDSVKDFFVKGFRVAFFSLISAGMSATVLLPSFFSTVQKSPYQVNDASIPSIKFTDDFLNIFNFGKVGTRAIIIDKSSFSVNMYCGLLMVLLIPIYLFCKNIKLSERIKKVCLLGIMFIAFGNPLLNYIFHGLHRQIFVPNRFSIFFIFLLITIIYDLIMNRSEELKKKPVILFYIWELIIGVLFILSAKKFLSFPTIISLVFIVFYAVLLTVYKFKKDKKGISKIIALTFVLELLITAFNFTRYTIYSTHINRELDSYTNASIMCERNNVKADHARTEYLSAEANNSMILNTESISFFSSSINQENLDMMAYFGADVPLITNNIHYTLTNPISDIFLNVKYNLTNKYMKQSDTYSYMKEIDNINNISLYENPYNVGFGFLIRNDSELINMNNDLSNGKTYNSYVELQNDFSNKLVGEDLYELIEFETDPEKIQNDPHVSYVMSDYSNYEEGNPNAYVTTVIAIGDELKGEFYLDFGILTHLASKDSDKQEPIYIKFQADQYDSYAGSSFYLAKLNEDTLQKIHDKLSDSVLYNIYDEDDDINATIDASGDGLIYVSLPYKDAFTVKVDGKEVKTQSLFKGIGIPVTAGTHQICISYRIAGLDISIWVSIAFLLFFIGFTICTTIYKKRKQNKADEDTSENISDIN